MSKSVLESMGSRTGMRNSVDFNIINSKSYRDKFNTLTNDPQVNTLVHAEAVKMLEHRAGSDFEDLVIINASRNSVLGRSTNAKTTGETRYTKDLNSKIIVASKRGDSMIAVHNHSNSLPPSASDIASLKIRGYSRSVVACHNGRIFVIDSVDKTYSPVFYNEYFRKMMRIGHSESESAILSLRQMEIDYHLKWRELT